jgi:drug/metabolite transporter (DMT)-like permease
MRRVKLAAVLVLWALSFILNEIALRDLGPIAVAAGRWLITALLIMVLVIWRGQGPQFSRAMRADWRQFFVLSLVGVTLLYGLQVIGQSKTSAVNSGLLANTVPIFTALLATLFLGERLRMAGWLGIVLALLGAWIVSVGGLRLQFQAQSVWGDLLVLASSFAASLYFVVGKRLLATYSPLVVTAAAAVLGAATLTPMAWAVPSSDVLTWSAAAVLLALGIGPGLLSNLWWWETAEWLDASRAALYIYLIPLITMILAVLFLGEAISPAQVAGTTLVLAGVWLAERGIGYPLAA